MTLPLRPRSNRDRNARCSALAAFRRGSATFWVIGLLALVAILGGSILIATRGDRSQEVQVITHTVASGPFINDVVEQGEVESARNVEVRCEVKSGAGTGTTILEVVDEGTLVKKGDVMCRLDSSAFEQELVQQQIICNTAEAVMIESKNTLEAALIEKKEFTEGTFHQEEQTIQSEIFIAEENVRRAKEYVQYSKRLAARGYVTAQQLEGDEFAVEKAITELAAAKTKLRVLQEYTKARMLKQLDSAIKSAEAKYKSDQSSYQLELSNLKDIEEQIENCTLRAPEDGQVVHANQQSSRSSGEFVVEPGAMVRENQVVIRLPDQTSMQVTAKINESRITLVKAGMKASIRLDAYGDLTLEGEVTHVNEYPEPSSWFSSQVKQYGTFIKILGSPIPIRPGLTAEVTIHVEEHDNVTQIPSQAIYEHGRNLFAFVQIGDSWEARPIDIGSTNDKFVIIHSGLQEGEVVAMAPRKLVDLVDLPELSEEEKKAAQHRSRPGPPGMDGGPPGAGRGGPGGGRPGAGRLGDGRTLDGRPEDGRPGDPGEADRPDALERPGAGRPEDGGGPGAGRPGAGGRSDGRTGAGGRPAAGRPAQPSSQDQNPGRKRQAAASAEGTS